MILMAKGIIHFFFKEEKGSKIGLENHKEKTLKKTKLQPPPLQLVFETFPIFYEIID